MKLTEVFNEVKFYLFIYLLLSHSRKAKHQHFLVNVQVRDQLDAHFTANELIRKIFPTVRMRRLSLKVSASP